MARKFSLEVVLTDAQIATLSESARICEVGSNELLESFLTNARTLAQETLDGKLHSAEDSIMELRNAVSRSTSPRFSLS
jgi:hypothetical protein